MIFNNMFDSVSPSYHDKTVELAWQRLVLQVR